MVPSVVFTDDCILAVVISILDVGDEKNLVVTAVDSIVVKTDADW